jgi:hypothetical protein
MLRVINIVNIEQDSLVCELNNGHRKRIFIQPILKKHAHFKGIEKLNNIDFLQKAKIGKMGEIYWEDAVYTSSYEKWNYDISPEYIDAFGEPVEIYG